jgi:Tfp pilus assembly protein PilW
VASGAARRVQAPAVVDRRALRALRRLWRDESGFNLVELLVAMALMIIVLGAVLGAFNQFERLNQVANVRNDTQDRLRTALDRLAHNLRNLAGTNANQSVIDTAGAYDLMFLAVDPTGPNTGSNALNLRRVRYCLDDTDRTNEILWMQVQTWTSSAVPTAPSTASCPSAASGWTGSPARSGDRITNQVGSASRPAFSYTTDGAGAVTLIHADLFVNTNSGTGPPTESHLSTGVFLRNQAQPPTASFTATPGSNYTVTLNGSVSADPEGQPLTYVWYDGATKIGTGITMTYQGSAGSHTFELKVYDPAGLEGDAPTQTVTLTQ